MALRSRSNRAVIGFLVGAMAGYVLTRGNLFWTLIAGIIGAIVAAKVLE